MGALGSSEVTLMEPCFVCIKRGFEWDSFSILERRGAGYETFGRIEVCLYVNQVHPVIDEYIGLQLPDEI